MFKRLEDTEKRFVEIEEKLSLPEVMNDQEEYKKLTKYIGNYSKFL